MEKKWKVKILNLKVEVMSWLEDDIENMFKHQSLYLSNNSCANKEVRC